jgi:hypothetical protein
MLARCIRGQLLRHIPMLHNTRAVVPEEVRRRKERRTARQRDLRVDRADPLLERDVDEVKGRGRDERSESRDSRVAAVRDVRVVLDDGLADVGFVGAGDVLLVVELVDEALEEAFLDEGDGGKAGAIVYETALRTDGGDAGRGGGEGEEGDSEEFGGDHGGIGGGVGSGDFL